MRPHVRQARFGKVELVVPPADADDRRRSPQRQRRAPELRTVGEMVPRLRRLIQREISRRDAGAQRRRGGEGEHQRDRRRIPPHELALRPQDEGHRRYADERAEDAGARERQQVRRRRQRDRDRQRAVALDQRAGDEHRQRDVEVARQLVGTFEHAGDAGNDPRVTVQKDAAVRAKEILGERRQAHEADREFLRAPKRPVVGICGKGEDRGQKQQQAFAVLERLADDRTEMLRVDGAQRDAGQERAERRDHDAHGRRTKHGKIRA